MKIAVVSVTSIGDPIAEKLKTDLDSEIFLKSKIDNFKLDSITKYLMTNYEAIIFIASTGIAVRAIAPYLKGKTVDPAIVVVDVTGTFAISLVSGHLGGANELTAKIGNIINATTVITTATDRMGIVAPDIIAKNHKLEIEDLNIAKEVAVCLINGEKVAFYDEENIIKTPKGYLDYKDINNSKDNTSKESIKALVVVTNKRNESVIDDKPVLKLIRKNIILGIGCRKDYSVDNMKEAVIDVLKKMNIHNKAIKAVCSIDVKKKEKAIIALASYLSSDFIIYPREDIKNIEDKYEGSEFVKKTVGVKAVCEPVVELYGAKLLTRKLAINGMTLCVGKIMED